MHKDSELINPVPGEQFDSEMPGVGGPSLGENQPELQQPRQQEEPAVQEPAEPPVQEPEEQPEESPLPEESPEIESEPVPEETELPEEDYTAAPETTEEFILVEEQADDKDIEALGFKPGLAMGLVLGAVLCALMVYLIRKIKVLARPKKASYSGVVVQGIGAREEQQDALFISDTALYKKQGILMCVADGMGGMTNGGIYSSTAASAAAGMFANADKEEPQRLIANLTYGAIAAVNRRISPDFGTGGTTFLLGLIYKDRFYCSSVGDSRICLCRDGSLINLNRQHVYEDELMLHYFNGEASYDSVKNYEKRGALTSYLGMGPIKYVDLPEHGIELRRGDRLVLMSDGVFNTLSDSEIAYILSLKPSQISDSLKKAVEGKRMMYQDNYSAVVVALD